MRLIDADKLKAEILLNKTSQEISDVDERQNDVVDWYIKDVDNQPTVEAIPIEFIKRFATFYPPTPTYIYGEESIDMGAWCEELLEHWEKENE